MNISNIIDILPFWFYWLFWFLVRGFGGFILGMVLALLAFAPDELHRQIYVKKGK